MEDKKTDKNKENNDIDNTNIFDEFATDSSLLEEVDKLKKEKDKNIYYYLSKFGRVLQIFFWILLFIIAILFSYIYIQNNEEFSDNSLLTPVCFLFIGDIENKDSYCSSISALKSSYTKDLSEEKDKQVNSILNILESLYEVEYFTKSKDVLFLTDKSNNKLQVLALLEEFDSLKNEFDKVDKEKIQCKGVSIDSKKKTLSMTCVSYSAGFEKRLRGFDGGSESTLRGTSISLANSFLNFIEKKSDIFSVIDRQKIFKSNNVIGDKSDFTNSTSFKIKLKYNLK